MAGVAHYSTRRHADACHKYASVRAMQENRHVENVEMGLVKGPDWVTWISVTAGPIAVQGTASPSPTSTSARHRDRAVAPRQRGALSPDRRDCPGRHLDDRCRDLHHVCQPGHGCDAWLHGADHGHAPSLRSIDEEKGKVIAAANLERRRQGIAEIHEFKLCTKTVPRYGRCWAPMDRRRTGTISGRPGYAHRYHRAENAGCHAGLLCG